MLLSRCFVLSPLPGSVPHAQAIQEECVPLPLASLKNGYARVDLDGGRGAVVGASCDPHPTGTVQAGPQMSETHDDAPRRPLLVLTSLSVTMQWRASNAPAVASAAEAGEQPMT